MHIFRVRLASLCHPGPINDPLLVSKFHNETQDPKGQENIIYSIVKGRETFYRHHTVPVTSCSEVKYVLKRVSFGSKDCTKELKLENCIFPGHVSLSSITMFILSRCSPNTFLSEQLTFCLCLESIPLCVCNSFLMLLSVCYSLVVSHSV